jgi:hypothetical protein
LAPSSTRTERIALAAALVIAAGCSDSGGAKAADESAAASARPVVVSVSIDWEGAYFGEDALAALGRFRAENPDVPVTHFICAAYYTKPGAVPGEVTASLRAQVRPGDEVGVHLHAWNSLVQAAQVPVRSGRSFLTADGRLMDFEGDAGFDLDPAVYTVSELRSILATSRGLLEKAGFKVAPVFRVGGWLGSPNVLEAARAEGFTVDSSATDSTWIGEGDTSTGFEYLTDRVAKLWPKVDRTTQPFTISTPAGPIFEVPDSGAMADHTSSQEMEDHVRWAASQARRPIFVHLGLTAETADDYAALLSRALGNLRRQKVPVQYVTVGGAAELARAQPATK